MKITQFLICLFIISMFSCNSDSKSSSDSGIDNISTSESQGSTESINSKTVNLDEVPKMDEVIDDKSLEKKMLKEAEENVVDEVANVESNIVTKLEGKSDAEKKKEADLKAAATKKSIEKSENKGMSCDQILKDQTKLVNDYMSSKDIDVLRKLMAKQNDPFFQECSKSDEFTEAIDALMTKMEEM